jgi:hypothetical protein
LWLPLPVLLRCGYNTFCFGKEGCDTEGLLVEFVRRLDVRQRSRSRDV